MRETRIDKACVVATYRWTALLAALALAGLPCGCSRMKKSYVLRTEFSINVGFPAAGWPKDIEKLTKAEQDAMRVKGHPEMIHVWWLPSGDLITRSTFFRMQREPEGERPGSTKLSWIYLSSNEEVIFSDASHWRTQPLSDRLRTVCEVGDPQDVQYRSLPGGEREEKWVYYNQGYIYRFVGDRLVDTDKSSLPPLPNFLTR